MEANGIVLSPDPRLRQECAVIEEITPAIEALAEKMKKMMFENGGCGLAAPQIGELIQLVTIDCDYSDKNDYDPYVLINPVIVEQSDHLVPFSEGCLSIPGISCEIERPDHVVVEAYDLDANLIRYEATGDLFCVCLQHEMPSPDNPSGVCGYLMSIYTRPEHQGKGVGTAVVRWLVDKARRAGAGKVYLEATEAGRPVYTRVGFTDLPDMMILRKDA